MSMNRQPLRLPLVGSTLEHLRHRERIDWHDHAEQQLVYPSHGLLIVSTPRGSCVVPPQRAVWLPASAADAPRPPGEQDDLTRVVLHQLRPATALQFHLPQPADERLRDVTAILAGDPGS